MGSAYLNIQKFEYSKHDRTAQCLEKDLTILRPEKDTSTHSHWSVENSKTTLGKAAVDHFITLDL